MKTTVQMCERNIFSVSQNILNIYFRNALRWKRIYERLNPINYLIFSAQSKTRWRSWFKQCATSLKVVGSIPDGDIGIFHWHNPSGLTTALGSTQPLKEMSTRDIS
jgi:hypothetical protein